ncbi:1,2-dihydroxy-3-keto-5-methylthiopentene dioxygenase [Mycena sanguinolenta]|uniref:Glutamine synthetase n=1 Tax=Mycena sanguinolenta TaxID=230812 RepID=A0A8H6ZF89_9AGAR|nr:1,2-dihydroxy-3-keto-5-methylthiopentene dioxygenase [Mycena sanguinolenta]
MDYSHGVVHSPQSVQSRKWDVRHLDSLGCSYVRIYWVDLVNIRRCRIVPLEHFKALLRSNRPGVNITKVCLGLVYLIMAPGFHPTGEYLYTVDTATLRPCPFAPGHWAVLGQFEEKTPIPRPDGTLSVKVNLCPRTLLRRILEEIKQFNIEFLVGFESEFILLKSANSVEPVNIHDWSASVGLLAGSVEALVLQEIADSLQTAGIALEMFHPEAAPGQYEVVTGPLGPMEAADALIYTREIIVHTAAKHGLHATFAPRPFMTSAGSSAHAHISVHSTSGESEPKPADKMSTHESVFLAGLLAHLPAIAAFTLPTSASYKRMADGVWSGGTYVCYGTENREAPVRLTNATSPSSRNFEVRCLDGTANPHLALAALLAGGLIGIRDRMALEIKDCGGSKSAAEMEDEELRAFGITTRMPLSIARARTALEQDSAMCEVLGKDMVDVYLSVNKTLEDALTSDPNETRQLIKLIKFY